MRRLPIAISAMLVMLLPRVVAAADHFGDQHWIQDPDTKCWVYNAFPDIGESIDWSGSCSFGGEATGEGTVTWFKYNAWTIAERGGMQNGKMYGEWVRRFADGRVDVSYWDDGVRQADSAPRDTYTDQGSYSNPGPYTYEQPDYMKRAEEERKAQNAANCERASKGANVYCDTGR